MRRVMYKLRTYKREDGEYTLVAYRYGRPYNNRGKAGTFYIGCGTLKEVEQMKSECEGLSFTQLKHVKSRHSKIRGRK